MPGFDRTALAVLSRMPLCGRHKMPIEPTRAIAAYLRVSSASQNLATQRSAVSTAAFARGHKLLDYYEEKGSGRRMKRPELDRLRTNVRAGLIQTVYVYKLDRLTRSGIRDTLQLLQELEGGGCTVVSVADGFDLQGPVRDVVVSVLAWAAQMERLAIGERVSAARARVEKEGGSWGRPRKFGEAQVQDICQMKKDGLTVREIAKKVKAHFTTVQACLYRKGLVELRAKPLVKTDLDAAV